MNFSTLIQTIQQTHTSLQQQAVKAINRSLTIRNWLIGFYIVEYEQKGEDRAKYATQLIDELANKINIRGLASRNLHLFRLFYLTYPHILQTVSAQLQEIEFNASNILQTVSAELPENNELVIDQTSGTRSVGPATVFPKLINKELQIPPEKLVSRLSFSHITLLLPVDDPLKRTFYEIECIKGNWSVRELKRQINSLYFERSGLSKNPEKLSALLQEKTENMQPTDVIKSVYTFEFLGLHAKDVIEESDLETALLDHLQEFMLELGNGFCLEGRQKRILIGDEYFFIDLVFYHRILKCHVLIDLKVEEFTHANAGQLNTYLNYYKAEVAQANDNPPVGILLVTDKNKTLVEYATAGMDKRLFVSKYLVELPSKEQLEKFVQNELRML